jgi:hypothetical protein
MGVQGKNKRRIRRGYEENTRTSLSYRHGTAMQGPSVWNAFSVLRMAAHSRIAGGCADRPERGDKLLGKQRPHGGVTPPRLEEGPSGMAFQTQTFRMNLFRAKIAIFKPRLAVLGARMPTLSRRMLELSTDLANSQRSVATV